MKNYILLFIVLFSNNLFSQIPSYISTVGLISWYPFNGNTLDESTNNNNGISSGAILTTDRFGNSNSAYLFNGISNYIQVASNSNLDLINSFTISSWFSADQLGIVNMLLSKHDASLPVNSGTYAYGLWDVDLTGSHQICFQASPTFSNVTYPGLIGEVSTNTWYNFVVTYNKLNDSLIYYLNGVKKKEFSIPFNILNNNFDLLIGANNNNGIPFDFFSGKIDDIGIWNRVLSETEISSLFSGIPISVVNIDKNEIKVFPIPSNNYIIVDRGNNEDINKIIIKNLTGLELYNGFLSNGFNKIDISKFPTGLYYIELNPLKEYIIFIKN